MSTEPKQDTQALSKRVMASLRKADKIVSGLRKTNTRIVIASISCSAASTLVAGITAAQGPVVGEGTEGWRLACTVAAVLAFITTVATGLGQQLRISDRLSEANQCIGKLRSLDVAITTNSRDWEEIAKEYQEIAQTFPELIG